MQSPVGKPLFDAESLIKQAQAMADNSHNDIDQAKEDNDKIIAALQELQQLSTVPAPDAIKNSVTKQYEVITIISLQGKRLARMMAQNDEMTLYKQQISLQGNSDQANEINKLYNSMQINTVSLAGDIEKNLLMTQQMIILVIDILQKQAGLPQVLIAPLLQAEQAIGLLLSQKNVGNAQQAALLAIEMSNLDTSAKDIRAQAQKLVDEIIKLLPPPPAPIESEPSDTTHPQKPSEIPTVTPSRPRPATIAPGKAGENIQKANNKISSAIRRIETIKKYYPDIDQEEKSVIKKKATGILKEYEGSILSFKQKIQQAKHEAGNQLDDAKLAPFNTFLELVNKLSNSVNSL